MINQYGFLMALILFGGTAAVVGYIIVACELMNEGGNSTYVGVGMLVFFALVLFIIFAATFSD